MRSAAHAEHRAVHSHHHYNVQHAAALPGDLKRLAFWATLHRFAGCAFGDPPVGDLQRNARTEKKRLTFQAWQDG